MKTEENQVLCEGIPVSCGIVYGRIKKITGSLQVDVSKNDIIVLERSDPLYAVQVMSAGGVIIERGGRLAHLSIIALEMGIPCITQVENALDVLTDGQQVLLDANEGKIYEYR